MKRVNRTKTGARPRPGPGFTLVELLVVMGIIGLLIGLLIPAVNAAIVATRVAATKNIIEGLDSGCQAFHSDWGCFPPSKVVGSNSQQGASALPYYLLGWQSTGSAPFGGTLSATYALYYSIDAKYNWGIAIMDALQPQRPIFYFCANKTATKSSDVYDGTDSFVNTMTTSTSGSGSGSGTPIGTAGFDTSGPAKAAFYSKEQFWLTCKKPKPGASTDPDNGWDWVRKDYMIISCGPDRYWGPVKVSTSGSTTTVTAVTQASDLPDAILDDITNFN
jgi:prepilin-type N-terminal cleavage/methylation domain-containing protein